VIRFARRTLLLSSLLVLSHPPSAQDPRRITILYDALAS
jgi:hypothetical protein